MMTAAGSGGARPEEEAGFGERAQPAASPLSLIRASHDHINDLVSLTFFAPAAPGDPRRPLRAVDMAVAAISIHMYAVQTAVYPMARRRLPDRRACVTELYVVAREIESVTRGISQHIQGDVHRPNESMQTLHNRLAELEEQHVAIEDPMVAELDETLSGPELRRVMTLLERSVQRAPTRSHPHLPRTAVLSGLVLRVAGSWDHVLDAMDARVAADTPARAPIPAGLWGWYLLGRPIPSPQSEQATGSGQDGQRNAATRHDR
ncbi:hemerythrin domain-containing protein [Protofrankia symbiont of Coriaria ruscifolia]|uniref:Hemerythrin-like domain-containing protein n=1 Tax=Candidatus Protofrankia californiensis TaxID=1839754 RepID=A0A1C3PGP1_9ACTN|nr:hemerythrin domain-containing protein [Protofrankia symbiont of Coriaria ruscifolia]SBW28994.1 hypothetical protein FDG2_6295 [Candidatus Protofrankia californiensis]